MSSVKVYLLCIAFSHSACGNCIRLSAYPLTDVYLHIWFPDRQECVFVCVDVCVCVCVCACMRVCVSVLVRAFVLPFAVHRSKAETGRTKQERTTLLYKQQIHLDIP